jgi:ABC-2 type transport system permease protein
VQFVVTFPPGFHRDLLRGKPPTLLVEADATDPMAANGAISVLNKLAPRVRPRPAGPLRRPRRRWKCACTGATTPRACPRYNIVPGLIGVILTMTMVLMTGLAMTRERERGTLENLLATPATPRPR